MRHLSATVLFKEIGNIDSLSGLILPEFAQVLSHKLFLGLFLPLLRIAGRVLQSSDFRAERRCMGSPRAKARSAEIIALGAVKPSRRRRGVAGFSPQKEQP